QPQRVGVVPLLGPVVVDQVQPYAVRALELGLAVAHRVGPVADHDRHIGQTDRRQVTQREVEDRELAVYRYERFRQMIRIWPQPPTRTSGQYQTDHAKRPPRRSM